MMPVPGWKTSWATERLLLLIANTYGSTFLDKELRAREFEILGRLLDRVPVRRLDPPGRARLPA